MEDAKDIFKNKLGDKVDDLKKGDEAVVPPIVKDKEPDLKETYD